MALDTKDIVDIYQLEAFCHHAVDHDDQSLLPLVFTEDARFDGRRCGGELHVGIAAIQALFALGKPPHPASHHMTNCWVHEEDGKVRVKMKWMVPGAGVFFGGGGAGVFFGGDNDDWVVRTDAGWRIKERVTLLRYPDPAGKVTA